MPDDNDIDQQRTLLATYRRTLAHLMEQAAHYGGEVFAPSATASGIAEARSEIARIKATLRSRGVDIDDLPDDEAAPPKASITPSVLQALPSIEQTITTQNVATLFTLS